MFLRTVKDYKHLNQILEEKLSSAQNILRQYHQEDIGFDFEKFEQDLRETETQIKRELKLLLQEYYQSLVNELEAQQKIGLLTIYQDNKNILLKFQPDALLTAVNVKFLEAFESWFRHERGNKDTTISVKIRNIRNT